MMQTISIYIKSTEEKVSVESLENHCQNSAENDILVKEIHGNDETTKL